MRVRRAPWWIEAGLVVAVGLGPACEEEPQKPPIDPVPVADSTTPLEVAYAGCKEVWLEARPLCLVEPGTSLRLWIPQPRNTSITVHVDDEVQPVERYFADGMEGFGLEVELPVGAKELVLEREADHARWLLAVQPWSEGTKAPPGIDTNHTVDEALGRAFRAGKEGRRVEALELLANVEDLASRYPKGQADHATYRGLAYWRQGRFHEAATLLALGVTFAMRMHDAELIRDSIPVYAAILAELGYWDAAVDWSEQVQTLARAEPELFPCLEWSQIMTTLGYLELLRARQEGLAPVGARPLLEQALARVGPHGQCPNPPSMPAILLSLADEALDRGDPVAALATLADVDFEGATCDERLRLRDAELRALARARHPLHELEEALARLEGDVACAGLAEGRWRLALRRGEVLEQQGRFEAAIVAYQRAEAEAQQIAELAAVGVGREAAVTLHAQSTERLVGLLAKRGRMPEALCAAREAQARKTQAVGRSGVTPEQREALDEAIDRYQSARRELDTAAEEGRQLPRAEQEKLRLEMQRNELEQSKLANEILHAQSGWRPSCGDLVPREPHELLLGLYPASGGWFVFVQDDAGTDMGWIEHGPKHALEDPALGSELLEPLAERLRAASRVRVLASGRAQDIDVHLLEWDARPLLEHLPVTYGAELPRLERSLPTANIALLLADPTETLPRAPAEVLVAATWMKAHGWGLNVPLPDEADPERILAGLAEASLFYFSGHGEHDLRKARSRTLPPYAGGTRDWPARLRLKTPTMLEVQEVLMLPSAPRHVVLLGCETGVPGGGGGGMSLALAFLVAGADEVVATPVETADTIAVATGLGLLGGISASDVDLAAGLRAAQVRMLHDGEPVGRYRVWVR